MIKTKKGPEAPEVKFPGIPDALDGSAAVVAMETAASEAAGAYPITPSTQMGEGWAMAVAQGQTNVFGRRLVFFEPEGEHAAAGVTAGMSMVGLRATNFSSGQGIAYMHESLYAAAGKRLTYVLNVAARAMTKQALNVHAGHDDYHAVDDSGFFQLFGKDVQEIADLTLIAHRIAELALTPGLCAQDGFLTSHVIESMRLPERELVKEYLGDPSDIIESPTPAQRMVYGRTRRRIPEVFDLDYPAMFGVVQNQDSYAQGVAAQRPFYFDHVADLTDRAMDEYGDLTGRHYARTMGYRMDDADYVLLGQGSVVPNCEAVADHLRETRGLKVGVVNLVMFRPFPADLITRLLQGRRGVTVFERVDQPLAVDPPVLREIRAAMSMAVENGRAGNGRGGNGCRARKASPEERAIEGLPYPGLAGLSADDVPDFYAAGFGLGSRDLQPGDIVATVENMLPDGDHRRHFYLGIDFIRKDTRYPKLQIWQEELLDSYPGLDKLTLDSAGDLNLLPDDAIAIRIHSVGGWGAITTGKNLAITAFELAGLRIKANPKYGSEKKGQPTNFYATLSHEPVRLNAELKHVNVVLSPDPNVFLNGNPLAGLERGGVFVIQSDRDAEDLWGCFPAEARAVLQEREIRVYALDGFKIAAEEATDSDLRYRMQGAAFMGAFFRHSPLMEQEGLDEERLFEGVEALMQKKFGHRGQQVVDDNMRVIRRGFDEVREIPTTAVLVDTGAEAAVGAIPALLDVPAALPGVGNPGRFWEQVCAFCMTTGQDTIADPFAAIAAIPAATSSVRDMTNIRFEVPEFIADKCTGCSQCWVQCPDAAIPGIVNSVDEILEAAVRTAANGRSFPRFNSISRHLVRESNRILQGVPFTTFGDVISSAYCNVVEKLGWDGERRALLDEEFSALYPTLADFPLARTSPFFDLLERAEKGSGGLLSITVNPEACKGCNICVEVCPEQALITVRQDDEILDRLRRNWDMWENLPDTDDRFINIRNLDEGIGVLSSLLLKKKNYRTMAGGDGACMGCGEKTAVHILVATIEGSMQPRVEKLLARIQGLASDLDAKARALLTSDMELDLSTLGTDDEIDLPVEGDKKERLRLIAGTIQELEDLRWRYLEGPGGKGRAPMGISNSTGCSSVWGSTYPYNPYPFPWVNHLFQDAPSVAIGIFEGHMRKMADNFVSLRRAELLNNDEYDAPVHEPVFQAFDWRDFSDDEFDLCPPILAMGGDGAMLDIGFQNLSRLLASGKPIRVVVLDTQVYSNTGGQSCTSGFTGQISDMAQFGKAQKGKEETRKELSFIALAHRGAYVLQSSQAAPTHMIAGILKGLKSRRPAVFNLYTPCPVEHGLADEWAPHSARLSLESRAFPFLVYDPDAGDSLADCLDLSGNPAIDDVWPTYELKYVDDQGAEQTMELPVTIADWAATEGRFKKQFRPIAKDADEDDLVPFARFLELSDQDRSGKTPFIYTLGQEGRLDRLAASTAMVTLAEDRLHFWSQLKELAGLEVSESVLDLVTNELENKFELKVLELRAEYEARMEELKARYPRVVARKLAEGLIRSGAGGETVADLLARAVATPGLEPIRLDDGMGASLAASPAHGSTGGGASGGNAAGATAPGAATQGAATQGAATQGATAVAEPPVAELGLADAAPAPATQAADEEDEALGMDPYVDSALCTTCNDCTDLNGKMFVYDDNKQAYIKDARAGTFAQLVQAAERCPAGIIHPGTPLDPKEKNLDKWIARAEPFN